MKREIVKRETNIEHRTSKNAERRTAVSPPQEVTSLSQLEQMSNGAPVIVEVKLREQWVRFTGRRLKPVESKEIKLLLEAALPPLLPPEKEGGQVRYDYRDPGYLRKVEENRRKARALALHAAYAIFKEGMAASGEPVDENRIAEFIESRNLDDDVLDVLFKAVIERVVDAASLVGFS
jgi:hypothetical protein